MTKNIILIGGGGLGREIFTWFNSVDQGDINIKGFLDTKVSDLEKYKIKLPYLGDEDIYSFSKDDYVVITISDIQVRNKIYMKLKDKVNFANLVHPTSIIADNISLGQGNIICPNCIISNNVKIGNNNLFNINSSICHDSIVKNNVIMAPYSVINGNCTINDDVFLGSHSTVFQNSILEDKVLVEANTLVKGNIRSKTYICGVPGRSFPR